MTMVDISRVSREKKYDSAVSEYAVEINLNELSCSSRVSGYLSQKQDHS